MREKVPFRLRGHEVSRIEAFSDVVFGFALTLVVVSLEVPDTFKELMAAMRRFPAFAICFAILTWVWHAHHTFFRRYALKDNVTIALNAALLFMVLLYTFPLKFLFSAVTGQTHGGANASTLFVIYGLGFAGIFGLFVALYGHAWRQREELELNAVELHDTRTTMMMYGSYVAIGLASALIGAMASPAWMMWAGWMYFLIGPASAIIGARRGAQRRSLAEAA
ncbi:MAG TPA: TMEM175 family protein [Thermoanaerobaculia bacterium]|nr:TMEM175 family protein [Thermoanaerobaculia bacterium]